MLEDLATTAESGYQASQGPHQQIYKMGEVDHHHGSFYPEFFSIAQL
jgi:hypothetical protein